MRLRQKITRLVHYEYWPAYIFYLPFLPLWMVYSLRSFSLLYFTRVNPTMRFGGFMQYSKYDIIKTIPDEYRVKSFFFETLPARAEFYREYLNFPFIYKPDIGERGKDVHLFRTKAEFEAYIPSIKGSFILQSYCNYPLELGILYHRMPGGKSEITSVVKKGFLHVVGDGKSTLEQLAFKQVRAYKKQAYFAQKFADSWKKPVPENEIIVLEEIGNHCRGTQFIDACEITTPELVAVFDRIAAHIPDFHYGRFDLKVTSIEDLYAGKNIQIFELNGVNSEVAHIYDPRHTLLYAYMQVYRELKTVFTISRALRAKGIRNPNSLGEFFKALKLQFGR